MSKLYPVINIQCDWHDALRLPKSEAWISAKYLNTNSIHEKITTAINQSDGKVKINVPENYQLISKNNLSLVLRHNESGLKVAFVACTKAHDVHKKSILSVFQQLIVHWLCLHANKINYWCGIVEQVRD
ncbi:unnamed protein product [Danaus chrysippus]|uniref:(African queen) hypothetical protein n=1 Tax=Danaus chrysippus TaxID=151541 RepID=A0A8J2R2Y8_9NEOP|nr:unnamed protein product [Danaus chrysippus]